MKKDNIRRIVLSLLPLFLFFICFACDNKKSGTTSQYVAQQKQTLSEKVEKLQAEINVLKQRLNGISNGYAVVSTEEKGYDIAQTKFGSFAVVCKDVTQYLDGYKVRLDIGNLTSARFNGAKIRLLWGKEFNNNKELSVTDVFPPGRYTTVEIVMSPAQAEDIKTFTVALEFNQMALY